MRVPRQRRGDSSAMPQNDKGEYYGTKHAAPSRENKNCEKHYSDNQSYGNGRGVKNAAGSGANRIWQAIYPKAFVYSTKSSWESRRRGAPIPYRAGKRQNAPLAFFVRQGFVRLI